MSAVRRLAGTDFENLSEKLRPHSSASSLRSLSLLALSLWARHGIAFDVNKMRGVNINISICREVSEQVTRAVLVVLVCSTAAGDIFRLRR